MIRYYIEVKSIGAVNDAGEVVSFVEFVGKIIAKPDEQLQGIVSLIAGQILDLGDYSNREAMLADMRGLRAMLDEVVRITEQKEPRRHPGVLTRTAMEGRPLPVGDGKGRPQG